MASVSSLAYTTSWKPSRREAKTTPSRTADLLIAISTNLAVVLNCDLWGENMEEQWPAFYRVSKAWLQAVQASMAITELMDRTETK